MLDNKTEETLDFLNTMKDFLVSSITKENNDKVLDILQREKGYKLGSKIEITNFLISDIIEIDEIGEIIRESPLNYGLNYFMKNQKSKENKLKAYAR